MQSYTNVRLQCVFGVVKAIHHVKIQTFTQLVVYDVIFAAGSL